MAGIQRKALFQEGCLLANFSAETTDATSDLRIALVDAVDQWCRALAELIRQAQACGEIGKRFKADFLARTLGMRGKERLSGPRRRAASNRWMKSGRSFSRIF